MSDIFNYYNGYQTATEDRGYKMEKWKDVSRVAFLGQYLTQLTPLNGSVLDIGCGDMWLAGKYPDYKWTGLDAANEYSQGRAIVYDLMKQPYPVDPGTFDTVICSEVLEHVWTPNIIHQEAFKALKPGGHYIISTPNFNNISWVLNNHKEVLFEAQMSHHYEHIRWFTYDLHKRFLEEAGFKVIDYTGADAHGVDFLLEPRAILFYFMRDVIKKPMTEQQIDQLLGQMFRKHCATIMLVAKKEIKE